MLIVKSGLPGNPIKILELLVTDAYIIAAELVAQSRSFYYEPGCDGRCYLHVDPEHVEYILKRVEEIQ